MNDGIRWQAYVPYINYTYGMSGRFWGGWFKALLTSDEQYFLMCMLYIELNPMWVNMVNSPGYYRWNSYRYNAQGKGDVMMAEHPLYTKMGRARATCCENYKNCLRCILMMTS